MRRVAESKCKHVKKAFRVTSGDLRCGTPHASVWVCSRQECIEDAKEWAYVSTHIAPLVFDRTGQEVA